MNDQLAHALKKLFELSRPQKRMISVTADLIFVFLSLWVAYALRLETWLWRPTWSHLPVFFVTGVITIAVFVRLGLYRAVIRYISEKALMVVLAGVVASGLSLVVSGYLLQAMVPRSVPVMYGSFLFIMVAGTRFGFRALINRPMEKSKGRVLIVGTGSRALELHHALIQGTEYRPMGFVTLDSKKHRSLIAGFQVYAVSHLKKAVNEQGIQRVFLALDDNVALSRKELITTLEELQVPIQTVPAVSELVAGTARINDIRDLDPAELLGREPVQPSRGPTKDIVQGRAVMVTGAGGSIGSELCRQLVQERPSAIVLMEQSEYALYSIDKELKAIVSAQGLSVNVHSMLGSVLHRRRCEAIMRTFKVDTVYHAAAYKHVPLVESNVIEGLQNNVMGTRHCAEAAIAAGVNRFVLISTDKAVRPANVMGATKRMAELVLQGLSAHQQGTIFSIVRFGNVLGSSGSVVPLFRDQIRSGGPVTVTHPEVIRYFMTIPEAGHLVRQAAAMGKGGEVFVLNMGEPVKIADLAKRMIRLMGLSERTGLNSDGDIEIVYTGLRPGEKLYEELLIGDNPVATTNARIMMAREACLPWAEVRVLLDELAQASQQFDCDRVVQILSEAPTGFSPQHVLQDELWSVSGDTDVPPVAETLPNSSNVYKFPV
ncbi:polysaccharide biosynthesis protein [Marinobacter sp. 1-4A]|uniref:polysaccharide biosynthesis protein n=1 Tax=unclassified Marinobacter TaxID=83889 RepID=UPI0019089892|nr:nucleoside-diphosphate sugar epimerase/dehydratase [Marinobacter sp. 1-4A]MBK1850291.1 polysaccharide biosynthesis protein [Marinobacter sp. 1-4A]